MVMESDCPSSFFLAVQGYCSEPRGHNPVKCFSISKYSQEDVTILKLKNAVQFVFFQGHI